MTASVSSAVPAQPRALPPDTAIRYHCASCGRPITSVRPGCLADDSSTAMVPSIRHDACRPDPDPIAIIRLPQQLSRLGDFSAPSSDPEGLAYWQEQLTGEAGWGVFAAHQLNDWEPVPPGAALLDTCLEPSEVVLPDR